MTDVVVFECLKCPVFFCFFVAADLSCEYSADFGDPRVEWKLETSKGIEFVFYNNQPTGTVQF